MGALDMTLQMTAPGAEVIMKNEMTNRSTTITKVKAFLLCRQLYQVSSSSSSSE